MMNKSCLEEENFLRLFGPHKHYFPRARELVNETISIVGECVVGLRSAH